MTTLFIIWPVAHDSVVRDAYEAATGEAIQTRPALNAEGSHFMIGSSRATSEALAGLPYIIFGPDFSALGWVEALPE